MFFRNIMMNSGAPVAGATPAPAAAAGGPAVPGGQPPQAAPGSTQPQGGGADAGLAQAAADGTIRQVASAPGEPQMIEYKALGKTIRIPLHEAVRKLALVDGSQARFQEAAEMAKTAKQREQLFAENPYKYYRSVGKTHEEARQLLENHAIEVMREDNLTPEQKQMRDLQEQNRQFLEEKEAATRAELTKRQQVELDRQLVDWDNKMTAALQESKVLPPDPFFKVWATDLVRGSASTGLEVTPSEAMREVEYRYLDQVKKTVGQWDAKIIKQVFGNELISKLRKDDIGEIRSAEAPFAKPTPAARTAQQVRPTSRPAASESSNGSADTPKSRGDFFAELRGHNFKKKA